MGSVIIFSREPMTLGDIQQRVRNMGYEAPWMPITQWYPLRYRILSANAVILDEADEQFVWLPAVDDLEQWILSEREAIRCMFLLRDSDRHLDGYVRSDPLKRIHRLSEELADEELYSLFHSQPHTYADSELVSA